METASFAGFFRTLLYIIAFYYVFRFLVKLFLPLVLKKVVEKAGSNFDQQRQNAQDNSWNKTQSSNDIYYQPTQSKNPKETKKVGDYVDYEEID
ncbi:DUF4834 domain-containing protein [Flavobacterium faecale]|uniref:DUF4834 domain-containing protein n=1 Tax=Flavobacterium faecale TaxID=1355330 RepID=A0A2S1LHY7_9FLAO|nr:DUF4834 family protein [Flavobacterium faecale]AWG23410.1 DUF4834 domain-containing protein [Flavobacterium faecale]